jgi:hypothetical protein
MTSERFTIAHGGPYLPPHRTSSLIPSVGDLNQIGLLEPSVAAVFLALARTRAASARIRQGSVKVAVGRIATLTEPWGSPSSFE